MKKFGNAKITAYEVLDEFNETNNTERVLCTMTFVSDNSDDVVGLLISSQSGGGNITGGNVIVDIASYPGDTFDERLSIIEKLHTEGTKVPLTAYRFGIDELSDGEYTEVTNGERVYSSLTQFYLGQGVEEEDALKQLKGRLATQIANGDLEWHNEQSEEEEEEEKPQLETKKSPFKKR